MDTEPAMIRIQGRVVHHASGWPFGGVEVVGVVDGRSERLVASAITAPDGTFGFDIEDAEWIRRVRRDEPQGLRLRVIDRSRAGVANAVSDLGLTIDALSGHDPIEIPVYGGRAVVPQEVTSMITDFLVASRRVRVQEVAADLSAPAADSPLTGVSAIDRAKLLDDLVAAVRRDAGMLASSERLDGAHLLLDDRIVDPDAFRVGGYQFESPIEPRLELDLGPDGPFGGGPVRETRSDWARFGWALPDDQSYRDYLRGVLALFMHQQVFGAAADPTTFPDVVERQLVKRFFQDFRTTDRTKPAVNRLVIPIVKRILQAPTGSGFGFGISASSVPPQGSLTDRAYLDALLTLAPESVGEIENRYRLPLHEPDSTVWSAVRLNVYTLSRVLSDTAQGPVEPEENVIDPQLPGQEGKPILWDTVIGAAPFFLRFDEWLSRQQPFFPENLFAVRTQIDGMQTGIDGAVRGPWLDDARRRFLDEHKVVTFYSPSYVPYFSSLGEVHRSAEFLLAYGAADRTLVDVVRAIDRGQFSTASRLAAEAQRLLDAARPNPVAGEDWEPATGGTFARKMSFALRRNLRVSNISELTGTRGLHIPDGLESFFELPRPIEVWGDLPAFLGARNLATRLVVYQRKFVLPMLRGVIRTGLGDLAGAVEVLASVTGFFVGTAMLGSPAGMTKHPDVRNARRVVAGRLRWFDQLGDRPYTARLSYTRAGWLDGPYPLTAQTTQFGDSPPPTEPSILHPIEERYARTVQADAILAWAESLYRTDDAWNLERARELYKAVVFLHGEDPGTSAYTRGPLLPDPFVLVRPTNPRVRNQLYRARLALSQIEAGLNFYGYDDSAVPTLRYQTLAAAAQRWTTAAKSAQNDFLAYLAHVEQLDLDLLAAKAQEKKAQASVAIAAEQIEIAKAGVVVAHKLIDGVQKLIKKKQDEIEDSKSIFNQFKDYFTGMKSSISTIVDVGKDAKTGSTELGITTDAEVKAATKALGSQALTGSGVAGGLAIVGGFGAFAVLSTMTLQGMADAATKREQEFSALRNEALPAAQAAARTQERQVTIAQLHGAIAATELAYARDLIAYQNERFLNRDFWDALAGVARRSLQRHLDLAAQAAWFAERALAYQLATQIRVIRLGYFDPRMRDVGGVDRLMLDLAELEAVRLDAVRVNVPIARTYSLARDLPLAFGELKRTGRCTFMLSDDDLAAAHPGTFAHRVHAVEVVVDAPGTVIRPRGMLTNRGFSLLRPTPAAPRVPLVRFADAYAVSEFSLRTDMARHGTFNEQLLPFEGLAFTTTWQLEIPPAANPVGLSRITDVLLSFDVQARYDATHIEAPVQTVTLSRSLFVSALSVDTKGLTSLREPGPTSKVRFALDQLGLPGASAGAKITNLAVLLPGVDRGTFAARLRHGGAAIPFTIADGIAMSNNAHLSDGNPAVPLPLNAAVGASPSQPIELEITKGAAAALLATTRDVVLWVEYEYTGLGPVTGRTNVTLVSGPNPSVVGQPVTITATVSGAGITTATGQLTFTDASQELGRVELTHGAAALSVTELMAGTHQITGRYEGDSTLAPGQGAVTHHVERGATRIDVTPRLEIHGSTPF
jgi:hypothetical protein